MRDATILPIKAVYLTLFQSTHPMRDATATTNGYHVTVVISIHASHAGCDVFVERELYKQLLFQSTHPMRDATKFTIITITTRFISIHASHAGCDGRPYYLA